MSVNKSFFYRSAFILVLSLNVVCMQCRQKTTTEPIAITGSETALDRYVHTPDPAFHYEVAYQGKHDGYTYYVLKMISQQWLTAAEVDEPLWWHWVKIVVPDTIKHTTGLMWIGGGAKDDELPEKPGQILERAALLTQSVTAEIHNVPNQPLSFKGDDHGPRFEDAIIAYGWKKFLEGGAGEEDAIWLARLPMTKSVIRAMDAVSEMISKETDTTVDHYVVAGGSKRGWTTWTTATVDDRVVALVPIVIDMLNLVPSFEHHWRNYGFWAPAVEEYVEEGIMDRMRTPEFERLLEITEPYSYLDRFHMPKLLINATGDQFFQPDSWKFYWKDLPEEKCLRYVPNTEHSLKNSDAVETLISYYQHILDKTKRPHFDWSIEGARVELSTNPQNPPTVIKLWSAVSKEKPRDFRVDIIGRVWTDSVLTINPSGKYHVELPIPEVGWKAYMVELTFEQEGKLPLKLTTGVSVQPEIYPFDPYVAKKIRE